MPGNAVFKLLRSLQNRLKRAPLNITAKLNIALALILIVGLGSFGLISLHFYKKEVFLQVHSGADNLGKSIREILFIAMHTESRDPVKNIAESIQARLNTREIRLINHEGELLVSSNNENPDHRFTFASKTCRSCHIHGTHETIPEKEWNRLTILENNGSQTLHVTRPLLNEKRCQSSECHDSGADDTILAILDVGIPLDEVNRELSRTMLKLLGISLFILITVLLIGRISIQYLVTNPAKRLMRGIRRVSHGDLNYMIDYQSLDEIGYVTQAFNKMTQRLRKLRNQLIRAERLSVLGKLSAGVAHEINNPLTGILTFAEELKHATEPADERYNDYDLIIRETLRVKQIVRDLLDFAREQKPRKEKAHINQIVEWALSIVQKQKTFKNVRVELNLAPELPHIHVDPAQIQQIFINLFINAVEAMPEGGTLRITTRLSTEPGMLEIVVTDTGAGIKESDMGSLFEPFFTTKGAKGNGLGLAAVWGIVENHEGTINVESILGQGASFYVRLPLDSTPVNVE